MREQVIRDAESRYNVLMHELSEQDVVNDGLAGSHINMTDELIMWRNHFNGDVTEEMEMIYTNHLMARITTTLVYNGYALIHEVIDDNYIIAISER